MLVYALLALSWACAADVPVVLPADQPALVLTTSSYVAMPIASVFNDPDPPALALNARGHPAEGADRRLPQDIEYDHPAFWAQARASPLGAGPQRLILRTT